MVEGASGKKLRASKSQSGASLWLLSEPVVEKLSQPRKRTQPAHTQRSSRVTIYCHWEFKGLSSQLAGGELALTNLALLTGPALKKKIMVWPHSFLAAQNMSIAYIRLEVGLRNECEMQEDVIVLDVTAGSTIWRVFKPLGRRSNLDKLHICLLGGLLWKDR